MSEGERAYPERTDLNYLRSKVVTSKKTSEQMLVVTAKDKSGQEYSVWFQKKDLKAFLTELANMF